MEFDSNNFALSIKEETLMFPCNLLHLSFFIATYGYTIPPLAKECTSNLYACN